MFSFALKIQERFDSAFRVYCYMSFVSATLLVYSGHREGIAYLWLCFPGLCWHWDVMWVSQMNMLKKK